jgi:hypothetical protein
MTRIAAATEVASGVNVRRALDAIVARSFLQAETGRRTQRLVRGLASDTTDVRKQERQDQERGQQDGDRSRRWAAVRRRPG